MQKTILCASLSAVAASFLAACGGDGSAPVASAGPSADQQAFEAFELHGGSSTVQWSFPATGTAFASGTNYIGSQSTSGLSQSPATAGPQFESDSFTSLDATLPLPDELTAPTVSYYLANGAIVASTTTTQDRISYVGTAIQRDVLADDRSTAVDSVQLANLTEVALSGAMSGAPAEFMASVPLGAWSTDNYLVASANWQAGAAYMKVQVTQASDSYEVADCPSGKVAWQPGAQAPQPCNGNAALSGFFPYTPTDGAGPQGEVDTAAGGTFSTVQGLQVWVASTPLTAKAGGAAQYRAFIQSGNSVYMAYLTRAASAYSFTPQGSLGSPVNYMVFMNKAAVSSIQQGLNLSAMVPGLQ